VKRSVVVACAGPPGHLDLLCNDCDSRVKVKADTIENAVAAAELLGWRRLTIGGVNCPTPSGRISDEHRDVRPPESELHRQFRTGVMPPFIPVGEYFKD